MEPDTAQNGIAELLRVDTDMAALLPGQVWTRRIRRNTNPAELPSTPGSTPEAFDAKGRILRCASVLNTTGSDNPLGPYGAYWTFPEIHFRCLPHESEKLALHQAMRRATTLLDGAVLTGLGGEGLILHVSGRMDPDDDPELPPAVIGLIRVQIDSVWR